MSRVPKMKFLLITIFVIGLCSLQEIKAQGFLGRIASSAFNLASHVLDQDPCQRDVTQQFTRAYQDFANRVYKRAAFYNDVNFILSPLTMWLSLSAIAEGADKDEQRQLFEVLNLPEEQCVREQFYQIASNLDSRGPDVTLKRHRALVVDEKAKINQGWEEFAHKNGLISVAPAPLKRDPASASDYIKKMISMNSSRTIEGTSILVDSLDYEGLWTTAFPKESIERAPFYDEAKVQIGEVDLMRTKMKVRMAYLPFLNVKVLQLPVGNDGRYSMLIGMGLESQSVKKIMEIFQSSIIVEIIQTLSMSLIPMDIAIPKISLTSEFDARDILEDIGVESIWTEPSASKYVAVPPPIPSAYMQRVTVNIDSPGVHPPPTTNRPRSDFNIFSTVFNIAVDTATGFAKALGRDFIANQPFVYTLIDVKTKSCLFAGAYNVPTYA